MKRKWIYAAATVAVIGAGVVAWNMKARSAGGDGQMSFATATRGPIEQTVDATGEVSPLNRVEIKPPISGRIEKLLVDEGAKVKAGDILAWMSSSDRAAILDAARAQGEKEMRYWQDAYKPTPIIAPLSGSIIVRNVVVGQTVDSGTVLFAMSDKLIVLARVDEADIGSVRPGMDARITLDAYPDETVAGKVAQILHEGTNISNVITYGVKIEPESVPPFFRSQMTANVNLISRRKDDAVILPSTAVREDRDGGKMVLVPVPDGKPRRQEVATGIDNGRIVEILSGIKEGDRVIVSNRRYVPQKGPQDSPLTGRRRR